MEEAKLIECAEAILEDKFISEEDFDAAIVELAVFYLDSLAEADAPSEEEFITDADNESQILAWFKEAEDMIDSFLPAHGKETTIPVFDVLEEWDLNSLHVKNVDEAKFIIRRYFKQAKWQADAEFDENNELKAIKIIAC